MKIKIKTKTNKKPPKNQNQQTPQTNKQTKPPKVPKSMVCVVAQQMSGTTHQPNPAISNPACC